MLLIVEMLISSILLPGRVTLAAGPCCYRCIAQSRPLKCRWISGDRRTHVYGYKYCMVGLQPARAHNTHTHIHVRLELQVHPKAKPSRAQARDLFSLAIVYTALDIPLNDSLVGQATSLGVRVQERRRNIKFCHSSWGPSLCLPASLYKLRLRCAVLALRTHGQCPATAKPQPTNIQAPFMPFLKTACW